MKALLIILFFTPFLDSSLLAQEKGEWTESDRQYILDNLGRTKALLIKETETLSPNQWKFKESPDRWSIREVVEHLAIWELLFDREISQGLSAGPQTELMKSSKPDSVYLGFILEEKPHITTEYTKPFTFTVPMGMTDGQQNLAWWLKMRNESIAYISTAKENLREYFLRPGRPSVHQVYINVFGHIDRHLRQIRKIKQNKNFPRK